MTLLPTRAPRIAPQPELAGEVVGANLGGRGLRSGFYVSCWLIAPFRNYMIYANPAGPRRRRGRSGRRGVLAFVAGVVGGNPIGALPHGSAAGWSRAPQAALSPWSRVVFAAAVITAWVASR